MELNRIVRFDRHNITDPQDLGCENWLKLVSQRDMTLERFEEVLSVNPYEYVPAHPLWCCCPTTIQGTENVLYSKYIDLLKKYDYEIISLKFEPKHYVTIFIERVLKNNYKLDLLLEFKWFHLIRQTARIHSNIEALSGMRAF